MDRNPRMTDTSSSGTDTPVQSPDSGDQGTATGALSRRSFLKAGAGALGALALLEASGIGFLFLQSRSQEGSFGEVITAGPISEFAAGTVTEFPEERFFLVCAPDGGFLAVHNRCPHLGCTVIWIAPEGRFLCPCHAATFDFYGSFGGPPVPRPLDTFRVHFQEGMVRVDTAQPRRRQRFSPDQLEYPPAMEQMGRQPQKPAGGQEAIEG